MRNANQFKIPYSAVVLEMKKWSGIRIRRPRRDRIITKA